MWLSPRLRLAGAAGFSMALVTRGSGSDQLPEVRVGCNCVLQFAYRTDEGLLCGGLHIGHDRTREVGAESRIGLNIVSRVSPVKLFIGRCRLQSYRLVAGNATGKEQYV